MIRVPVLNDVEKIADFEYVDHKSILLRSSRILIGTGNTLEDAALYKNSSSLTMDLTLGAANLGLDTGTEANNQWYAVYAVPGANGSYGLRFSGNAPPQAGGSGPVGFTKYRYLGLIRNGTNNWDATNGSYGIGDIVRFVKEKNRIDWKSFSSNNGGVYPAVAGMVGINNYIANTATDSTFIDFNNNSVGFSGSAIGGGARLPYRDATYLYCYQANTGAEAWVEARDSTGSNIREYFTTDLITTIPRGLFWYKFLSADLLWSSLLQHKVSGNPNLSRAVFINSMIDPYIIGGGL